MADPVEMAADAFLYIGLDDDDRWTKQPELIYATVAFLRGHLRLPQGHPRGRDYMELRCILDKVPVDRCELRQWFYNAFRTGE